MKTNINSTPLFSAYPLKALMGQSSEIPASNHSPYLKAILSSKTRPLSRERVFPMIHPYRKTSIAVLQENNKLPKDIELTEKEWFNNYE
ncbi:MAG: hypothetical protein JJE22_19760 [Bacteroidia bacterium]|nr:hypothetical protein [Bacteroidia bacterium]